MRENGQRYVVAVSGGVDSVVLLDKLARAKSELVVAHFDHGIRLDSAADARFVEALAAQYGVPFVTRREELGAAASEELARKRRHAFLREVAKDHEAKLATAHHYDDVVETIAINLIRGTGWRGLAVFDSKQIVRPLLGLTKQTIREYARDRRLEWVEDSTNGEDVYLRNRLRRQIVSRLSDESKEKLWALWAKQLELKHTIDSECERLLTFQAGEYPRYFFTHIDPIAAEELLRTVVSRHAHIRPTRPQTMRALLQIKTARAHSRHDIGQGVKLRFTPRSFIVETP